MGNLAGHGVRHGSMDLYHRCERSPTGTADRKVMGVEKLDSGQDYNPHHQQDLWVLGSGSRCFYIHPSPACELEDSDLHQVEDKGDCDIRNWPDVSAHDGRIAMMRSPLTHWTEL